MSRHVLANPRRIEISPEIKRGSSTVKREKIHCDSSGVKISGVVGMIGSRAAGLTIEGLTSSTTVVVAASVMVFFFLRVIEAGKKTVDGVEAFNTSSRRSLSQIWKCSSRVIVVYCDRNGVFSIYSQYESSGYIC